LAIDKTENQTMKHWNIKAYTYIKQVMNTCKQ